MNSQAIEAAAASVDYDPFADGPIARVAPTTESQREVWVADKLSAEASLSYNESVLLRLRGELDAAALAQGVQQLVDRHDALRSGFGPDGETLCVGETLAVGLETIDLAALDGQARETAMEARKRLAVETPFALESGPLFRAELLRLSPADHLLILTAHHIVCDGWSWWVMVRELASLYARATGHDMPALPAPASFADYALAQAEHPDGATLARDERYWLSRFDGEVPVLDLPLDRPRPARRTFASLREDHLLDASLLADIKRVGARQGASLFATLLGGFATLLSRLSGQAQVVVGIPAAGQSVDGNEALVGHCVNLLPLRFDIDPAQPSTGLVEASQATLLDAIDHQRYTFGTLLKKLRIDRDPARLPLVSVMFNIDQAVDRDSHRFPGLASEFESNPRTCENFELFVNAVQIEGGLRLECQYNRDLFDATTIRRWLAAFETLLGAMARQPDDALGTLPLVDDAALQALRAMQPAPVAYDRDIGVHALFERQCERAPQRIAVRSGADSLTYAQLEARANRIAHLLRAQGVHRGALVGLAVDRGTDMLASLLGILKAGAGYVPLDPGFPADRLTYMAGDAGLAALVTQSRYAANFDLRGRPVLALEDIESTLASLPASRVAADARAPVAESVAYVIYTSGSTGRPKGVRVPHRAVVNFLQGMQREPGLGEGDTLLAVTTLSFDIAVLELLLPLTVGAQVVLADRDTAMDGAALAALLADSRATVMQATPATWRMLIETQWRGGASFKALCGGEPLPHEVAGPLLSRCGELWNLYGPTETTVWSTCARIAPAAAGKPLDIHIGQPIANTDIWIVDERGELCPYGVPGEICIGGEGVTLGYLERPELTAERFVADRFGARREATDATHPAWLYRTGDRGRWRGDGMLQHMGRLDFQVKIRGYRIELGEVENMLVAHPGVANAVAIAREDRPGDVRLVAYVVGRPGAAFDEPAMQAHLRQTLPEYMIPQHVLSLKAMPLLPNGKLDRKALPAPNMAGRVANTYEAPRNALEQRIAEAMADVLGLPQVSIHDDFFVLGGHSLLAAKLTTRLARDLETALSLRTLFDAPTVARLASLINTQAGETPVVRDAIQRRADQRHAPLTLLQERVRMVEAFNPGTVAYNTPSAHRLTGPLDVVLLDRAFRDMAQRQTVLRTSIVVDGNGESMQRVHDDIETGLLHVEDLTALPHAQRETEAARRMRALIDAPLGDLDAPPLFRMRLYKVDEQTHLLFFMPHHIIWDGWSFDLVYAEISETYAALAEGRAPVLAPLPVTYGDYAAWQRAWMQGPEYAAQVDYWKASLGGDAQAGRLDALPSDHPRKRGMAVASKSFDFALPAETSARLHAISNRMGVTLFNTLLAAYYAVLAQMAKSDDIVVGTLVRGRNAFEVENLMGYFTNLLPLRMRSDSSASFSSMASRTRDVLLDGFAHPDLRLEDLPMELSLRNDSGAAMFYHAQFSFQDVRHRIGQWGPLKHERVEVFQPGASEDIALLVIEGVNGLSGSLVYNSNLFNERTIGLMRDRLQLALQRVAIDPAQPLEALLAFDASAFDEAVPGEAAPGNARVADSDVQLAAPTATGYTPQGTDPMSALPKTTLDPRETYLLDLWSTLLGTMVLPSDNFFDIGGNSMLAVQMAERVARDTGFRIKLMRLAVQSAAEIAADLPANASSAGQAATGGLLRNVKRLFGAR